MDEMLFNRFAATGYTYIPVIRCLPLTHTLPEIMRVFPNASIWQWKDLGYTYINLANHCMIKAIGDTVIYEQQHTVKEWPQTLIWSFLEDTLAAYTTPPLTEHFTDLPPFIGGMIGCIPRFHGVAPTATFPDHLWLMPETLLIMDAVTQKLWLITYDDPIHAHAWERLNRRLDEIVSCLQQVPTETAAMHAQCIETVNAADRVIDVAAQTAYTLQLQQQLWHQAVAMGYAGWTWTFNSSRKPMCDFIDHQKYYPINMLWQQPDFTLVGASTMTHIHRHQQHLDVRMVNSGMHHDAINALLCDGLRNDVAQLAVSGSISMTDDAAQDDTLHHWFLKVISAQLNEDTSCFDLLKTFCPTAAFVGMPKTAAAEILAQKAPLKSIHPLGCAVAFVGWHKQLDVFFLQEASHWTPIVGYYDAPLWQVQQEQGQMILAAPDKEL